MSWECPIPSSQLSSYLESNRAPTGEDEKQILEIKASVGAVFTQSRASIGTAEATTEEYEYYATQKRCATILSPARHIPTEIWGEIFFHCLSTDRNPILSYKEAPLLLTHVSARWRSTALSTPHIWTRIHIHIIQQPFETPWSRPALDSTTTIKCNQITKWLELAGSLPLKISLSARYALRSAPQYPVFQAISLFSRHIQSLELGFDTPRDVPMTIFLADQLYRLEFLILRSAHTVDISNIKGILSAPSPRELSVGYLSHSPFTIPANWSKLSKLSIQRPVNDMVARELLTHCKFLVHCKLALAPHSGTENDDFPNIHCPHLQNLIIFDPPLFASFDSLLRWLHFPKLLFFQWSVYYGAGVPGTNNHRPVRRGPSPITILAPGFLPRLGILETFVINPDDFSQEQLLHCLSLIPSVKTLQLGSNPQGHAVGHEDLFPPRSLKVNVLRLLSDNQPTGSSTSHANFLLSNLESLEYYGALALDQDILDFIITRMSIDPASTHTPSRRLRNFTAWVDNRDMEMDISLKVRDRARELGIPFTLEICYADNPNAKYLDSVPLMSLGRRVCAFFKPPPNSED